MDLNKLLEIINEIKEINREEEILELQENTSLRKDIGFDSMDLAVLTAKIEDVYEVDIFADGVIDTVEEILKKFAGGF